MMQDRNNKSFYYGAGCFIRPKWINDILYNVAGRGINIAVIDSGFDADLWNDCRIEKGISFVKKDSNFEFEINTDYRDNMGHGTTCIDRILQIAPGARIIPVKVFNNVLETSPGILINAMNFAIDAGVKIINLSLSSKLKELKRPLYLVCEKAKKNGIIVVASYANTNETSYPAVFDNVISVGNKFFEDIFYFTYLSDEFVECQANGAAADALTLNHLRTSSSGSSFAAPIITGIIALLLEEHPGAALPEIRELLRKYSVNNRH